MLALVHQHGSVGSLPAMAQPLSSAQSGHRGGSVDDMLVTTSSRAFGADPSG